LLFSKGGRVCCLVKVVGLHKNPPTGVGGSFVSTYGGQTKELFKTTNGSWWIVSSNLIQRPE